MTTGLLYRVIPSLELMAFYTLVLILAWQHVIHIYNIVRFRIIEPLKNEHEIRLQSVVVVLLYSREEAVDFSAKNHAGLMKKAG